MKRGAPYGAPLERYSANNQLLLVLHGGGLHGEGGFVVGQVGLETGDFGGIRVDLGAGVAGEDHLVQEVGRERLLPFAM